MKLQSTGQSLSQSSVDKEGHGIHRTVDNVVGDCVCGARVAFGVLEQGSFQIPSVLRCISLLLQSMPHVGCMCACACMRGYVCVISE